jgi:hypothetical protein
VYLRVLEVVLSLEVTREGVSALSKLNSLEELISVAGLCYEGQDDLLGPCYELLPHLHVAAIKPEPFFFYGFGIMSILSSEALLKISTPHTLQLHHLVLRTLNGVPEHVALPEVRVLYLCEPEDEMQLPPGRFPKLTELNMIYTDGENLTRVVGHGVGQHLQTLRVSFGRYAFALQLDDVLAACPNLSELCINTVSLHCAGELRPDTLRQLQILRICSYFRKNMVQPGHLPELLRLAPNLRLVELPSELLSNEDLKQLTELVEQRACLRHLERLRFSMIFQGTNFTEQLIQLVDLFIVSCSKHCEQFSELVVGNYLTPWFLRNDL